MISKYLKDLIGSNNRIIIPDLGAFMIQDTPNGKQIAFNDFLKFNDGLLVNQIIKTDKVSKSEASEKIKSFTMEVDKSFSSGKPYLIEGVGSLIKDSHNNIKFESLSEGAGKQKPALTDDKPTIVLDNKTPNKEVKEAKKVVVTKLKADKKPEIKIVNKEVKPTTTPVTAQSKETPKPTQTKAEQFRTASPVDKTKTPPLNTPTTRVSSTKKPIKPPTKAPIKKGAQGDGDDSKKIIIIIAIALIIIGGGMWAFFHFDMMGISGENNIQVASVEVLDPVVVADSVVVDTVVEQQEVKEEPIIVEEPVVDNRTKYYIVGGSFKVVLNAENFSRKLIAEGFDSEVIVQDNGFNCVTYKVFYSWNEVVNEWNQMKNTHPQTWILTK